MTWGDQPLWPGPNLGWGSDLPDKPGQHEPVLGWRSRPWRTAMLAGEGTLEATAVYIPAAVGDLTGDGLLEAAAVPRLFTTAPLTGEGALTAEKVWPRLYPADGTSGEGTLSATAAFPARGPQDNTYTVSTTYTIPWWCRYLDLIGIGGGGGGRGGGVFARGGVGSAGTWAARTIERGVDIPWSLTTLTVTIGTGGTGGAGGISPGNGTAGGATTIASWLTAAGGAAAYDGSSFNANAGTYTYRDRPYTGGAMNNPPGGGGDGGATGAFGGRAGNPGAAGGAWITARQN